MLPKPLLFLVVTSAGLAAGATYLVMRPAEQPAVEFQSAAALTETPIGGESEPTEAVTSTEAFVEQESVEDVAPAETVVPEPPAREPEAARTPAAPRARPAPPRGEPAIQTTPPPAARPERPVPSRVEPTRPTPEEPDTDWTGLEAPWPSKPAGSESVDQTTQTKPTTRDESRAPLPEPEFEELIVSADSVIGLQVETTVSTERAQVEDPVEARVTRDVKVGDRVAVPAGSIVHGSVTLVDEGGKVKERARLGVRFHTVVMTDGTELPIRTETVYREGESPAGESTAKIGGAAVGGAIIGAILGGAKGAAIGGSAGAAGGTAAVMAGGRNPATLQVGSTLTVRLSEPVTVTVEK